LKDKDEFPVSKPDEFKALNMRLQTLEITEYDFFLV